MSRTTGILYADAIWNPVVGCSPCSKSCSRCWALGMTRRLVGSGAYPPAILNGKGTWSGKIRERKRATGEPLEWRSPCVIATCFMGDLFHENTPDYMIRTVFYAMWQCRDRHTFLILTKRPARMRQWLEEFKRHPIEAIKYPWPWPHVWLGTSVEDNASAQRRIPEIQEIDADVRFVSFEPLLGEIRDIKQYTRGMQRIDWAIIGAESCNGRPGRLCSDEWIDDLMVELVTNQTPVFLKQAHEGVELVNLPEWRGRSWYEFPRPVPTVTAKCEQYIQTH